MPTHPDLFSAQAVQCRRLARVILDPRVATQLLARAEELEGETADRSRERSFEPAARLRRWIDMNS
jgi:hypothetical protein